MNKTAKMRKDLSENPKSFTSFVKANYQKLMALSGKPDELVEFINTESKVFNVSEQYRGQLNERLIHGSEKQNQFYLTNVYLTGKGLSVSGI